MSLFNKIKNLDKTFSWSFLGFSLAILFGSITIYSEFFKDTRASIRVDIITNTNIMDVRERLGDLSIVYNGLDIGKAQKELRVITTRITNDGGSDIILTDYDINAAFGLKLSDAEIVKAEIISASDSYLTNKIIPKVLAQDTIIFNPAIIGRSQSFTIKSLALCPSSKIPNIFITGKIANTRSLYIADGSNPDTGKSFPSKLLGGSALIQAIRIPIYTLIAIIIIVSIISISEIISKAKESHKRARCIKSFMKSKDLKPEDTCTNIIEVYRSYGYARLLHFYELLSDKDRLNALMSEVLHPELHTKSTKELNSYHYFNYYNKEIKPVFTQMFEENIITCADTEYSLSHASKSTIISLMNFAKVFESI